MKMRPLINSVLIAMHVMLLTFVAEGQALSPRTDHYLMDIVLDTDQKKIFGKTTLTWNNPSTNVVPDLQFHLYYNAFKNSRSTFFSEGSLPGFLGKTLSEECGWSYTIITDIKDDSNRNLLDSMRHISPDDHNPYDETVLQVMLAEPVQPYSSVTITFEWEAKIPKALIRTGYNKDYYFMAQWYPKLGVYEPKGMRYEEEGRWNCHQYHASGEYYGEFGTYDVTLRVPSAMTVGASGTKDQESIQGNQKVIRFVAMDVIDFTWAASKKFVVKEHQWKHVKVQLLTYPEYEHFAERYFISATQSLEFMEEHVGEYPYTTLTIINPPIHGLFSGGMEYPTLISSITINSLPNGIKVPETLLVHEFVHQYFMQMVASHEQEEPWMDEGFTTYYEGRILDFYYGERSSMIDTWGIKIGNGAFNRLQFWGSSNPKIADNSYKARDFEHGGYSAIAYNKTAMMLKTLEGILGQKRFDEIMRGYFEKWKFRHPCGQDFVDHVTEELTGDELRRLNFDINLFFQQALYGSEECDYGVASISNIAPDRALGYIDNSEDCVLDGGPQPDYIYENKVVLHRHGEMILPVEVVIYFEDDQQVKVIWDGRKRSTDYQFQGASRIIKVVLDPDNKLDLEKNRINNIMIVEGSKGFKKYGVRFKMGLQHLFDLISYLS